MTAADRDEHGIDVRQPRPDAIVVSPAGEVDLSRSPALQSTIKDAIGRLRERGSLVVDLSKVTYMDSSGVATLVQGLQLSRKRGVALVLCALQDRVRSIFEIARLDTVFTMADSLDQALGNPPAGSAG